MRGEEDQQLRALVLSATMQPDKIMSWEKAICLVVQNKVDVLETYDVVCSSPSLSLKFPAVIRLRKHVRKHKDGVKFSRTNVLTRDQCTCFGAGTRILMASGQQRAIETLRPGDRVIDAFGQPQTVVANGKRIVDRAIAIKHRGSFERTVTTPEHPFLTLDKKFVPISDKPEYLMFPRDVRCEIPGDTVYETHRALPADRWMRLRGGRIYWSRRGHESGIPVTIRSSAQLAYMLGLYVAEGSASAPGTVAFSFCDDERETLAADAKQLLSDLLQLDATLDVSPERHTSVVRVGSKALAMVLWSMCGKGASKKRVPWELIGPHRTEFLRGLFLGDGTIDRARRKVVLGMTSEDVVFGAQSMLWGLGVYPTVQSWDEKHGHKQTWLLVMQGENYSRFMSVVLGENVDPGERVYGNEQFVYRKLQEIQPIDGDVVVYNLETTGSHSYIANGLAVHNCCYCGQKFKPKHLTYDHVLPRSRGGKTDWEGIVSACKPCNRRKGNKTPAEARMHMHFKPYRPTSLPDSPPLLIEMNGAPKVWLPYIEAFAQTA